MPEIQLSGPLRRSTKLSNKQAQRAVGVCGVCGVCGVYGARSALPSFFRSADVFCMLISACCFTIRCCARSTGYHRRTTVAPPSHHPRTTLAPPSHHPRTTLAPSSINGYPGNVLSPGRRGGVGRVAVHDACQAGPGQLGRTATSTSFLTTSSIVSALRSPFPITQHCHTTITAPSHCLLFCTVSLSVVVTIPAVLSPIPPTCTSCVVARARCAFPCFAAPSDSHTRLLLSHSTRLVPMLIVC